MGESTVKPKLTTVVLNSRPSRSLAVVLTTYPMLVGTKKTLTVWFFTWKELAVSIIISKTLAFLKEASILNIYTNIIYIYNYI